MRNNEKKNLSGLAKRGLVLSMIGAMAFGMIGCGGKSKEKTSVVPNAKTEQKAEHKKTNTLEKKPSGNATEKKPSANVAEKEATTNTPASLKDSKNEVKKESKEEKKEEKKDANTSAGKLKTPVKKDAGKTEKGTGVDQKKSN